MSYRVCMWLVTLRYAFSLRARVHKHEARAKWRTVSEQNDALDFVSMCFPGWSCMVWRKEGNLRAGHLSGVCEL